MKKYTEEQIQKMIEIIKEELFNLEEFDIHIVKPYKRVKLHKNIINAVFFDKEDNSNFLVEEMRKLDLSEVNFENKNMTYKDYSYTNIKFDPQKIKDKSLYNTNLKGTDMFNKDFTDVDIRGANLNETNATIVLTTVRAADEYTGLGGCHVEGNLNPIEEIKETFKKYTKHL